MFATASANLQVGLTKTNSTAVTLELAEPLAAGWFSHAQYVSFGRKVDWTKVRENGNCTFTTLDSGTINFPTTEEGWFVWRTRT